MRKNLILFFAVGLVTHLGHAGVSRTEVRALNCRRPIPRRWGALSDVGRKAYGETKPIRRARTSVSSYART